MRFGGVISGYCSGSDESDREDATESFAIIIMEVLGWHRQRHEGLLGHSMIHGRDTLMLMSFNLFSFSRILSLQNGEWLKGDMGGNVYLGYS